MITFENIIIAPNTVIIIPGEVEESKAHLLYEKQCLIEPIQDFEEKFRALVAHEIFTNVN